MTRRRDRRFDLDELLIDMEERNQGRDWPLAVDVWLEARVEQARRAGMLTTRKELSAALMAARLPTDDEIIKTLLAYRRATARDLLKAPADAPNVVVLAGRR